MPGLKTRRNKDKSTTKKKLLRRTKKKNRPVKSKYQEKDAPCDYFPTGSTRLNLALSGMPDRGWARGRVDNVVGDRSAGKTLLALEAAANFFYFLPYIKSFIFPKVKKTKVAFNNPEGVMDFNLRKMYGKKFARELEMIRSPHVQHMGRDFIQRATSLKKGEALLYIVDTWDFLRSKEQLGRFQDSIDSNKEMEASYDGEKQKWSSGFFAKTSELMDHNGVDATLMIISQVRKVMNARPFQKQSYRTGGKAFDHAMHQEAWISEVKKHKGTKFGEDRIYAIDVGVKIEKNKTAKPYRTAEFTILYDYGIDDLTSLFRYVKGNPSTKAPKMWDGEKFTNIREVVKYIERNNHESEIRDQAAKKFRKVEEAFEQEVLERKARWDSPIAG